MKKKTESIEEFLARGGKITIVPNKKANSDLKQAYATGDKSVVTILTMDEAALFFGEVDKKEPLKIKRNRSPILDVGALPAHLKSKFVDRVLDIDEQD